MCLQIGFCIHHAKSYLREKRWHFRILGGTFTSVNFTYNPQTQESAIETLYFVRNKLHAGLNKRE